MSELQLHKSKIVSQLKKLCAHCANGLTHDCPVQGITARVEAINGVPLIVNNEFRGVLWKRV